MQNGYDPISCDELNLNIAELEFFMNEIISQENLCSNTAIKDIYLQIYIGKTFEQYFLLNEYDLNVNMLQVFNCF